MNEYGTKKARRDVLLELAEMPCYCDHLDSQDEVCTMCHVRYHLQHSGVTSWSDSWQ